jgi:hypothetical protein
MPAACARLAYIAPVSRECRYTHKPVYLLDDVGKLLGHVLCGASIEREGLLLLYNLFQGASRVECINYSSDCAASLAEILLPLYTHEPDSLLMSMLTTLARQPGLGRFLCAFQGSTSTFGHKGGVFYGKKTSDADSETVPLAELLTKVLLELRALGGPDDSHHSVFPVMLDRRLEQLQGSSMRSSTSWGTNSWGDNSWGLGNDDWGTGGMDGMDTGGDGSSTWGGGGSGTWGYEKFEEAAAVAEAAASKELEDLSSWRKLLTDAAQAARCFVPVAHAASPADAAAKGRVSTAPAVSDFKCEARSLRSVETVEELIYGPQTSAPNDCCPISLASLEAGQLVRRLPAGHLLSADSFDELLKSSRNDGKPPRCPFTRRPIPPHVAARDTWLLASTPLECLDLDALVKSVPRHERGEAVVSSALGFDVSGHAAAKSAVAMDMLARIKADIAYFAKESNASCAHVLLLSDSAELTTDEAARAAAEDALMQLIQRLELQQSKDAAYVNELIPLVVRRANTVRLDEVLAVDQRELEIHVLRQEAGQEGKLSIEFLFSLLISSRSVADGQP